jgi:hypothetical protein
MARNLLTVSTVALAALLGGCASGGASKMAYDRAAAGEVRTIALIDIPNPQVMTIRNFGNPAAMFGGVAAGVAAASSEAANKDPLTRLLNDAHFDFSRELTAALTQRLQRLGYKVVTVSAKRENPLRLLGDYAALPSAGADAFLDVAPGVYFGYSNVSLIDSKFRPHVYDRLTRRRGDAEIRRVNQSRKLRVSASRASKPEIPVSRARRQAPSNHRYKRYQLRSVAGRNGCGLKRSIRV